MAKTPFDRNNYFFSEAASRHAERTIYPDFVKRYWPNAFSWNLRDTGGTVADMDHGIDRILVVNDVVTPDDGDESIKVQRVTVQERFRREQYRGYRQLTVTEKNMASGQDGDFKKLEARLYAYGYLGHGPDGLFWHEAMIVDVPKMIRAWHEDRDFQNAAERRFYRRKNQTILAFGFDNLIAAGCVLWHVRN